MRTEEREVVSFCRVWVDWQNNALYESAGLLPVTRMHEWQKQP
jgi:hypothetical protein